MEPCSSREEFIKCAATAAQEFAELAWSAIVEGKQPIDGSDTWMRTNGGALLRGLLGGVLSARAEALGVEGSCACGGQLEKRQHKPFTLHTVLPGRDVAMSVLYGQCDACSTGIVPILVELRADEKGFSADLRDLALRAATMEPYLPASEELLSVFAGVDVSHEKLQSIAAQEGPPAAAFLSRTEPVPAPNDPTKPVYFGIDGGMIHVDGVWQEVKMFCSFRAEDHVVSSPTRGALAVREVAAIRGTPEMLGAILEKRAPVLTAGTSCAVVLGDGAPWIWGLADLHFPNRVEILDWYHAKEHVAKAARVVYGDGEKADLWREIQLTRLWDDGVDDVIASLRFLTPKQRTASKRDELENLANYLTTNRHRMSYRTFRERGFRIGSGFVESAVGHVIQQRMKRTGMHWRSSGADNMLALRSLFRSHGAWDAFRKSQRAAA